MSAFGQTGVTACLLKNEPTSLCISRSKGYGPEAQRKRVLKGRNKRGMHKTRSRVSLPWAG